ncbi:MAG: hypothetical protein HC813_03470 [Planctomycetes bacterium]|nr:hypothetical protein [Planctomycetota bacterium]
MLARAGFDVVEGCEMAGLTMTEIERRIIEERLRAHGGNRAATARSLGLCEKTIYNKSKRYGLRRSRGQS